MTAKPRHIDTLRPELLADTITALLAEVERLRTENAAIAGAYVSGPIPGHREAAVNAIRKAAGLDPTS